MEIDGVGLDLHGNHVRMFDYGLYHHSSRHIIQIGGLLLCGYGRTREIPSFRVEELIDEGEDFSDGFVVSVFSIWDWSDGASGDISADAYISRTGYHPGIYPTGRLGCIGRCCVPWLTSNVN
ncbi:hypothetical protein OROMI_001575 [Orobanche minor]